MLFSLPTVRRTVFANMVARTIEDVAAVPVHVHIFLCKVFLGLREHVLFVYAFGIVHICNGACVHVHEFQYINVFLCYVFIMC